MKSSINIGTYVLQSNTYRYGTVNKNEDLETFLPDRNIKLDFLRFPQNVTNFLFFNLIPKFSFASYTLRFTYF